MSKTFTVGGTHRVRTGVIEEIHLGRIKPNPQQPRTIVFDADFEELKASILQHGMLQPILVRRVGTEFQIIEGHRRFDVHRELNRPVIKAIVQECSDDDLLLLNLVCNTQREDMHPVDMIEAVDKLRVKLGHIDRVAEQLGWSSSKAKKWSRLRNIPEAVRKTLRKSPEITFWQLNTTYEANFQIWHKEEKPAPDPECSALNTPQALQPQPSLPSTSTRAGEGTAEIVIVHRENPPPPPPSPLKFVMPKPWEVSEFDEAVMKIEWKRQGVASTLTAVRLLRAWADQLEATEKAKNTA